MRLVTRGDLDGLTSALMIASCEKVDSVLLTNASDISDRRLPVTGNDILVNLPYHPECGMWFDNHLLTDSRSMPPSGFPGRWAQAPSASRVVYDHYVRDHPELERFAHQLAETDRLDSAQLTREDVLNPGGYILLGYTLDPRTGLGGLQEYFRKLLESLKVRPLEEVLKQPEVKERVARIREGDRRFGELTRAHSSVDGNVVFTDFREVDPIPVGNRFLVYTLFPAVNVSVRAHWTPRRDQVSVSAGWSIFNRTCKTKIGVLMALYGGGGQPGAGACLLAPDRADGQIKEIIAFLRRNG